MRVFVTEIESILAMSVIISCSFLPSVCMTIEQLLESSGVKRAKPTERHDHNAAEIVTRICMAIDDTSVTRIQPGRAWEIVAADLLLANASSPLWGWACPENLCLLDFWAGFEPQAQFLLVYISPEEALAGILTRESEDFTQQAEAELERWADYHTAMLDFKHRNRDRAWLVSADTLRCGLDDEQIATLQPLLVNAPLPKAFRLEDRSSSQVLAFVLNALVACSARASEVDTEFRLATDIPDGPISDIFYGRIAAALREFAELEAASDQFSQRSPSLSETREPAEEEVKLLQMQLRQVQDELKYYFLRYQEILDIDRTFPIGTEAQFKKPVLAAASHVANFLNSIRSVDGEGKLIVDMRDVVDGTNWYNAEHDGRWAGPESKSSIRVYLDSGQYHFEVDIVDAMEPELLSKMDLAVDGIAVPVSRVDHVDLTGPLAPLRRLRGQMRDAPPYPVRLKGRIEVNGDDKARTITFGFPRAISALERVANDDRQLTVRFQKLVFLKIKSQG